MTFKRKKVLKMGMEPAQNLSFHSIIGPCLVYGQLYGMMPVCGILTDDEEKISFRWTVVRTMYSIVFMFIGTADSILGISRIFRKGFSIYQFEGLIFFMLAAVRAYIFFNLAIKWKKIMAKWKICEKPFLSAPYEVNGWGLKTKLRTIFAFLAIIGISKMK